MAEPFGVLTLYSTPKPYLESRLSLLFHPVLHLHSIPLPSRPDFLAANAHLIRAVIGNSAAGPDAGTIAVLSNLEIVCTHSVGVDGIDLEACRRRGIRVANTPGVVTEDVADLAVALAIAVLRKFPAAERWVREGRWKEKGDYALTSKFSGKVVGIIGLGRIGSAIAKRAEGFGCSICYHSRSEKHDSNYRYFANIVDLAASSDVLMMVCPLTEHTHHIVDRKVLDALGPSGILVNVGRGGLVDEEELVKALAEGRVGGAGLDVFEKEPEPSKKLLEMDNVVAVPHIGTNSTETRITMAEFVIGNLVAYVQKRPLLSEVV